jgi:NAD(P)-dependent dehydrogenase (short-subunit alcohol dehydrogenase family)
MLARRPESYEDALQDIQRAGGQAIGIVADVTDAKSLSRAFDTVGEALPNSKLAAAVYNVNSGFMMKPFLELQLNEFQNSFGKTG